MQRMFARKLLSRRYTESSIGYSFFSIFLVSPNEGTLIIVGGRSIRRRKIEENVAAELASKESE